MLHWQLFLAFLKIGLLSFGGGYAVIPMIQYESERYGWLPGEEFQRLVALAGMSPGPVATNSATLIGYEAGGLLGAIVATAGIVLPSLVIVIVIAAFFYRMNANIWVKSSFYGLRPIITGLIVYAAIHFGLSNHSDTIYHWSTFATLLIGVLAFLAIVKYKLHPFGVIAGAAILGIVLF
ncbi:chromate transporter [Paenibacillus phyllosphaerae]|uniref:Chromate transporter n=1 Tax=Paenibacillus phyllosphaerae TaxID=274593 RepID=A0A7W5FND3_9BACL|nr:chromate transporter [Paenibacillus phyllosphaerae]MBB3111012.1 chromate transporter [Paenibacillus phyllosphaerae]